jgi:hypothetical protein
MNTEVKEWAAILPEVAEAKKILEKERRLRAEVSKLLFPGNKEGTEHQVVPEVGKITVVRRLERKLDLALLSNILAEAPEACRAAIEMVPTLSVKRYKALTEEDRHYLDAALIIKPSLPTMKLEIPDAEV